MKFLFQPDVRVVGKVQPMASRDLIHEEPMLFGASPEYARACGGPLTQLFLSEAHQGITEITEWCRSHGMHVVLDTRSHMLMPGFYPAIPGWHCDAYPRAAYGEQPSLERGNPEAFHLVCFVSDQSAGVSRTLFVNEPVLCEVNGEHVWSSVHAEVERQSPQTRVELDGEILRFSQPTLHRARAAHANGWRWWVRVSCFYKPPENAIRRQVQVYAPEGLGW